MINRPVVLSAEEYRVAWRHLDIGEQHWALRAPGLDERFRTDRVRARDAAWDSLRGRGLVRGDHLIDPLVDALCALTRADAELNARLDLADGTATAVVASRGEHAVVAIRTSDGALRLHGIEARELTWTAASLIPDIPAADGPTVSVPAQALTTSTGLTAIEVEKRLVKAGVRGNDARNVRHLLAGRKHAGAKYGAARHDHTGNRTPTTFAVTWLHTERGGVTVEQKRGADRESWLTVSPADRTRLAKRLADLLGTVGAR